MPNGSRHRRVAAPVALLAALAVAIGGGSSAWSVNPDESGVADGGVAPSVVAPVQLEHLELVALRAQSNGSTATPRFDTRLAATMARGSVVAGIVAAATRAPSGPPAPTKAPVVRAQSSAPARYSGTNHLWIPALHISRPVILFPCSRKRAPDNYVYRWGCAGRNNVYLMGHAWGVMKPLHDAYYAGRLHKGMLAYYADGAGRVRTYAVTTWRVVSASDSAWAIASQRVPSMTLQTCVGTLRLNVRLVEVGS